MRDGTLVGYQLDRRMAALKGFGRSNGCAFADSPGARPDPADGQRLAAARRGRPLHRGADRGGRARHLRRRRQELVDRHAALQLPVHRPALLPDRGRPARRAGKGRRPTRPPRPTSGARSRPSAAADLRARRRVQLRQGRSPARSRRSATAARPRCSARSTCSTPCRRVAISEQRVGPDGPDGPTHRATASTSDEAGGDEPQEMIEKVLDLSTADDVVVIVDEGFSANLRFVGIFTTNGESPSSQSTVISIVAGRGVVSRGGREQLADIVAAADHAAVGVRRLSEDACAVEGDRLATGTRRMTPRRPRCRCVVPRSARPSPRPRRAGPATLRRATRDYDLHGNLHRNVVGTPSPIRRWSSTPVSGT